VSIGVKTTIASDAQFPTKMELSTYNT